MAHDSDGDTEALSEERLTLVRRALQRIAADHEVTASGHRKKLTRHQAVNLAARDLSDARLGLQPSSQGIVNSPLSGDGGGEPARGFGG